MLMGRDPGEDNSDPVEKELPNCNPVSGGDKALAESKVEDESSMSKFSVSNPFLFFIPHT
jgi:hypothetical protein